MKNKEYIKKYFDNAGISTEIGEHLFVLNTLLAELVKNTAPITTSAEIKKP